MDRLRLNAVAGAGVRAGALRAASSVSKRLRLPRRRTLLVLTTSGARGGPAPVRRLH